jgi:hypothetical protein
MTTPTSRTTSVVSSSTRPFLYVWASYSLLVLLGVKLLLFPSGYAERMDFRQLYAGAYLLRTDAAHLYDYERQKQTQDSVISPAEGLLPVIRPAYEALLFVPLSYLSYRVAYLVFVCCNLLLIGACFSRAEMRWRIREPWLNRGAGCSFLCFFR